MENQRWVELAGTYGKLCGVADPVPSYFGIKDNTNSFSQNGGTQTNEKKELRRNLIHEIEANIVKRKQWTSSGASISHKS